VLARKACNYVPAIRNACMKHVTYALTDSLNGQQIRGTLYTFGNLLLYGR